MNADQEIGDPKGKTFNHKGHEGTERTAAFGGQAKHFSPDILEALQ
jgi:hypothetical protein